MPDLQLVSELQGHSEAAWEVAFNPSRPLLASCSTDKTFRLFSYTLPSPASNSPFPAADDPKPVFNLINVVPTEHKRTIRSIAWAPSGLSLATGSFDSTVSVWEEVEADEDGDEDDSMDGGSTGGKTAKEWECVTALEGHESECKSVAFSYDGGLLASCSRDKSVWVWEVQPDADFECIAVMMEHSQDVKCIAWHPKEEILASASYDSHIHLLFDDPDGDWCTFQKLHPKLPITAVTVADPSPGLIAALGKNEEDEAVESLEIPPLEEDETVWSLAWSPCGRYLASGGDLGGVRLWTRTGSSPDSEFVESLHTTAHSRSVFSLSWATGGVSPEQGGLGLLASAGGDGKVIVWQVYGGTEDNVPEGNGIENGTGLDAAVSSGGPARSGGLSIQPIAATRSAHGVSDVNSVAWCVREDGRGSGLLATCGDDGGVKVWRVVQ